MSNDMVAWVLGFISGTVTGFILAAITVLHIGKKAVAKLNDTASPTKTKPKVSHQEISDRITKVREITEQQMDLQSRVEGPQRNAMDGKFKNGLNGDVKALEDQKIEILKSILQDGFDPVISVAHTDGSIENVPLSEFLARSNIAVPPAKDANDKVSDRKKNMSKFTVYTGGKPDGGTTH